MSTLREVYGEFAFDPYKGTAYKTEGKVTRILLFDRSDPGVDGPNLPSGDSVPATRDQPINSPVIAAFKAAIEQKSDVDVHVVHYPGKGDDLLIPEEMLPKPTLSAFAFIKDLLIPKKSMPKPTHSAFTFTKGKDELIQQLAAGYQYLSKHCIIDPVKKERDAVYLFGDEEGALVANTLAQMIFKGGMLRNMWRVYFKENFVDAFKIAATNQPDHCAENFRSLRAMNLKIDLLGLWYGSSVRPLNEVSSDPHYIKEVVVCKKHTCNCEDLLKHMLDAVRSSESAASSPLLVVRGAEH